MPCWLGFPQLYAADAGDYLVAMANEQSRTFTDREIANIRTAIVEHGYAFQHRAITEAGIAFSLHGSPWKIEVPEFPVQAGRDTRIDVILSAGPVYLCIECKRVNPALGQWVFARAPTRGRAGALDRFYVDAIERRKSTGAGMRASAFCGDVPNLRTYQIAFEVRRDKKGNIVNTRTDVLEDAIRQAVRGANGLVNYRIYHEPTMAYEERQFIVPVVFTTAELVITEIQLGESTN